MVFTVNPALERSFHGPSVPQGMGFSPSAKFSYDFNKYIPAASNITRLTDRLGLASLYNQEQQFFPTIDLNVSPNWEITLGSDLERQPVPIM